jgi:hypothetical protein
MLSILYKEKKKENKRITYVQQTFIAMILQHIIMK